jgi:hypothetical protein
MTYCPTAPFIAARASGRILLPDFSVLAPPALISGVTDNAKRSATRIATAVSVLIALGSWDG